jgi:hypothetical protein
VPTRPAADGTGTRVRAARGFDTAVAVSVAVAVPVAVTAPIAVANPLAVAIGPGVTVATGVPDGAPAAVETDGAA